MQQAAYALVPEQERRRLHLQIGRAALERCPPDALEERVFEIVNQLNLGREGLVAPPGASSRRTSRARAAR